MTMPWIARSAHAEMMHLLTLQVRQLQSEREVLLDRLATLGLGGPLFHPAAQPESPASEPVADSDADTQAAELEQLMRLRRRPSQLAEALTRKAYRDQHKSPAGPRVSWVPGADAVNAALDQAEAAGKIQA